MNRYSTIYGKILDIIAKNNNFAIYSHIKTDIDAIGCSLAMKRVLENMGKTAHVFIDSVLPSNSFFLNEIDKINAEKQKSYDVSIVLDCADAQRLGRNQFKFAKNIKTCFQIDHHKGNPNFARHNIVDENASSTCEMLYDFLTYSKIQIDREIATYLLSGIITDTGAFKYNSTSPKTLKTAAALLEKSGLKMDELTTPLLSSISREAFELIKLSLDKLEFVAGGKGAVIMLSREDLEKTEATFEDTNVLRDVPMRNKDLVLLAIATQKPQDGIYYVAVRSKGEYSARNVALEFGGGGHEQASGCKKDAPQAEVRKLLIESIEKEIKRHC